VTSTNSSRTPAPVVRLLAVGVLAACAAPGSAQVAGGDAFSLAAGGDLAAPTAESVAGSPSNPAGLARGEGWAFSLSPVRLDLSLGPVTGRDIARAGDGVLSRERRESWLRRVGDGPQRGGIDASVGPVSLRRGQVALDIATSFVGRSILPSDAVELLLFGNAGRDGDAGDFRLGGSALDGAVWTRVGLAFGARPDEAAQPGLAIGVRVHATVGHAALVTRDAGSVIEGDDATAAMLLPSISTAGGETAPGFGVGFDVGVTWRGAGGVTGVSLHDAVNSFTWSDSALRYRAGETLIEGEGVETDFEARPVSEAPASLRALARRLRPARRIEIEYVRRASEALVMRLTVRERLETGLAPGRPNARLIGVEWDAGRRLDLAAHGGVVERRARLGAGARVGFGRWTLSAAWSIDRGDGRDGSTVGVSVGR
jgi:hypothetical protein